MLREARQAAVTMMFELTMNTLLFMTGDSQPVQLLALALAALGQMLAEEAEDELSAMEQRQVAAAQAAEQQAAELQRSAGQHQAAAQQAAAHGAPEQQQAGPNKPQPCQASKPPPMQQQHHLSGQPSARSKHTGSSSTKCTSQRGSLWTSRSHWTACCGSWRGKWQCA